MVKFESGGTFTMYFGKGEDRIVVEFTEGYSVLDEKSDKDKIKLLRAHPEFGKTIREIK